MSVAAPARQSVQKDVLARGVGAAVVLALLPGLPRLRAGWTACRCPNRAAHPRGDATPSASVSATAGYLRCHGCNGKWDLVELAVLVGRTPDVAGAARWIRAEFIDGPIQPERVPVAAGDGRVRVAKAQALYARSRRVVPCWLDLSSDHDARRLCAAYAPSWPLHVLDALEVGFLPGDDARGWKPSLVFPVRDLDGALVAVKLRAAVRGATPKSLSVGGASRGLIGREQLLAKPDALVVLAAGEKDLAHGVGLLPQIAWTSGAIGEGNALGGLIEGYRGRDVIVLFDADAKGRDGAAGRAAELLPVARSVRVVAWPAAAIAAGVKDVADVVERLGVDRARAGLARVLNRTAQERSAD